MDLSKILSISGRPGLYKHVAQSKTSIVVESLTDGKRSSAFASEQISSLNDISVFTEGEDIKLEEVLKKIYEKEDGKKSINPNSSANELKKYFEEVLPEYDKDRVYVSDIKKIIKWYNLLVDADILDFKEPEKQDEDKKEEKEKSEENKTE